MVHNLYTVGCKRDIIKCQYGKMVHDVISNSVTTISDLGLHCLQKMGAEHYWLNKWSLAEQIWAVRFCTSFTSGGVVYFYLGPQVGNPQFSVYVNSIDK